MIDRQLPNAFLGERANDNSIYSLYSGFFDYLQKRVTDSEQPNYLSYSDLLFVLNEIVHVMISRRHHLVANNPQQQHIPALPLHHPLYNQIYRTCHHIDLNHQRPRHTIHPRLSWQFVYNGATTLAAIKIYLLYNMSDLTPFSSIVLFFACYAGISHFYSRHVDRLNKDNLNHHGYLPVRPEPEFYNEREVMISSTAIFWQEQHATTLYSFGTGEKSNRVKSSLLHTFELKQRAVREQTAAYRPFDIRTPEELSLSLADVAHYLKEEDEQEMNDCLVSINRAFLTQLKTLYRNKADYLACKELVTNKEASCLTAGLMAEILLPTKPAHSP